MTTLDDLKRAIEAIPNPESTNPGAWYAVSLRSRAEAWRLAFEWHVCLIKRHAALSEEVGAHLTDWIAIDREEEEGMALVREKLK